MVPEVADSRSRMGRGPRGDGLREDGARQPSDAAAAAGGDLANLNLSAELLDARVGDDEIQEDQPNRAPGKAFPQDDIHDSNGDEFGYKWSLKTARKHS